MFKSLVLAACLFLAGTAFGQIEGTISNLSLDDDVTVTGDWTFSGAVTLSGSQSLSGSGTISPTSIDDAAADTLLTTGSGQIHLLGDQAANTTIVFPTEAAGLTYEFWYVGGATEAHDHTFDTENDTNFIIGGVQWIDMGTDSVEILATAVYSDGNSNSKFTVNNMAAGTKLEFYCDGTNWYLRGVVYSDTAPAFADQ